MGRASGSEMVPERQEWTGAERLGLRVSEMINHPVAQVQRWVTIHQLDTDAQADWEGVMELLAGIDGLDMTFNDDGTVTARWEPQESQEVVMVDYLGEDDSPAPF